MTEIEELIKQARAVLKRWRPPRPDEGERHPARSWREILENREGPRITGYKD